jgi:hypothetical protein
MRAGANIIPCPCPCPWVDILSRVLQGGAESVGLMKYEESWKVDENIATKWPGRKRGAIPKPEVPLNLRFFPSSNFII